MKQIIPFSKDITFKTKIGELTSISLDHDLTLKGEDLILGNFYIKGEYKMLPSSELKEEYSYKVPCEIAISDDYDAFDATIDIDDFHYEIINDEVLKVNISLVVDNLSRKEIVILEEEPALEEDLRLDLDFFKEELEEANNLEEEREVSIPTSDLTDNNPAILSFEDKEESYVTYSVYTLMQEDTVETVLSKYKIAREDLMAYNNLDGITFGSKLIIPNILND